MTVASGIAWAPELPERWSYGRLRWLSTIYAGGTPDRQKPDYWSDGTIPWLNSGAVNDWAITKPSELISDAGFANSSARWVPGQSVVIGLAGQGRTKGTSARLEIASTTNQSMAAIVPGPTLDYRFLHYWLVSNYQSIRNLAGGDLRDGLNLQHIASIECPLPPMAEQRAIADYLDRETAQIDTLITKQHQLIATLRERRESAIAASLLSGLDPSMPTRVSEIGRVPAHWAIVPSRYLCTITTGDEDSGNATDSGEYPLFVRGREILHIDRYTFEGEAVMTPGDGQGGTGKVFHYFDGKFAAHQRVYVFHRFRGISPRYFYYYLSTFLRARALANSNTVTMESLRRPVLADFKVAVPPSAEQGNILSHIEGQVAAIDSLIAKAERFIELARERRSALITAAVTGQIDVRTV